MNLIALASVAAVIALTIAAVSFTNLTGLLTSTAQKDIGSNTSEETTSSCPLSCDDGNPCTLDYCNETTGNVCVHSPLDGVVNGCNSLGSCVYNTCSAGKCILAQKDDCCGNKKCEVDEACYNCPQDCECTETEQQPSQRPTQAIVEPTANNSEPKQQVTANTTPSSDAIQPSSAANLVISEVQIGSNEFIELYNPTSASIDTTGWYLSYFSSKKGWNDTHRNWAFPSTKIASGKYFLINIFNTSGADWTVVTASGTPYSSGQISTNGSIAIFSFNPNSKTIEEAKVGRVDAIGWGNPDFVYEKSPAPAPETGKSLERVGLIDTNDNLADYTINPSPTPKNTSNH